MEGIMGSISPLKQCKDPIKKEVISLWGDNLFLKTACCELHLYTQGNSISSWIT